MTTNQARVIYETVNLDLDRDEELKRIREIADAHEIAQQYFYEEDAA